MEKRNQIYIYQDALRICEFNQKYYDTYEEMIKEGKCPTGTPLFVCKNTKNWVDRQYFNKMKNKDNHYSCNKCICEIVLQTTKHNNKFR